MSSEEVIKPFETKGFASFIILDSSPVVTNMMATGDLHGR